MRKRQEISAALLGVTVAVILWITILNREMQSGVAFYPPFHTIGHLWKSIQRGGLTGNFLGNILLFSPVGILIPLMTGWKKRTIVVGTGFSIVIEIIQLITSRGCFDPDDVLLNTAGCTIGYCIFRVTRKLFTKNDLNAVGH